MVRRAIIIGVNKTGKLPTLSSAVQSAIAFGNWADSQDIDKTLLTDERGDVTIEMVTEAIQKCIDTQDTNQLIIYFSGHGILKGPGDEYWLLSKAPDDPNAAISVQTSRWLARMCGIPHVVFISDACRSFSTMEFMALRGSLVFGMGNSQNMGVVDMLYATAPGDPAYEVRTNGAQFDCHSIYTKTLLEGLHGKIPKVRESYYKNDLVMAARLSAYLKDIVPKEAAKINPLMRQVPDSEIVSVKPTYLSRFPKPPKPVRHEVNATAKSSGLKPVAPKTQIKASVKSSGKVYRETMSFSMDSNLQEEFSFISLFEEASRIEIPEMKAGFAIMGIKGVRNDNGNGQRIFRNEQGIIFVAFDRLPPANTYFLIVSNGNIYPLAVLPGFVGTMIFKDDILITVNYAPLPQSNRYDPFSQSLHTVNSRRAQIAAQSKNGTFRLSGPIERLMETAGYIREYKAIDPTLGLYAAYAYLQAGNMTSIASVYDFMAHEPEPVLFDVALLAQLAPDAQNTTRLTAAAPFCPMLTQGWSYLAAFDQEYYNGLKDFSKFTVPGLWTTFRPEASELINSIIL